MVKFPIVMDSAEYCRKCQRITIHRRVIYPDVERRLCSECGTKQQLRFDVEAAVIVHPVDAFELENIERDLATLANQIATRDWGKLGKKDADFLTRVEDHILAIARRVVRLKEESPKR